MTTIKLTRRAPSLVPFLPAPFLPFSRFPSFRTEDQDFATRTDEMMREVLGDLPDFTSTVKFPAINVSESKEEYTLTAELPGMTAKDVNIDYLDGVLTIRGEKEHEEKKEEDDRKYYMWERRFGSFQRSLPFPGGVNEAKIEAEFKDGILTVHLPKAEEAKVKTRPITITDKK